MFRSLSTYWGWGLEGGKSVVTPTQKRYNKEANNKTDIWCLSGEWDPRDFDWTVPVDEDAPWKRVPDVPCGLLARGQNGKVQVVPRAIHERLLPGSRPRTHPVSMAPDGNISERTVCDARTCGICFSEDVEDAITFVCGSHFFCHDCAGRYFRERLAARSLPKCPVMNCGAEAEPEMAQDLLDPEEFDQYLLAALRATNRLYECPACAASIYIEEMADAAKTASLRCPQCSHRICTNCRSTWHPCSGCADEEKRICSRRQRDASRGFEEISKALGFKRCPQCGAMCEKSDLKACDHMTCVMCDHHFCWTCLADRKVIAAHGNHFHSPSRCPFYAEYDGPLEFRPQKCHRCRARGRACTPPRV